MTDEDPHRLSPDHLPTPFTAAEIRAACPAGRTLRYRIARAGQDVIVRVTRYVSSDADGAVRESWDESVDGRRLTSPERDRSSWQSLQRHASFPAVTTERAEEEIGVPAGRFVCVRYTRIDERGTWRFWFARDLPGQPVRFEQRVSDDMAFSATLIENVTPTTDGPDRAQK